MYFLLKWGVQSPYLFHENQTPRSDSANSVPFPAPKFWSPGVRYARHVRRGAEERVAGRGARLPGRVRFWVGFRHRLSLYLLKRLCETALLPHHLGPGRTSETACSSTPVTPICSQSSARLLLLRDPRGHSVYVYPPGVTVRVAPRATENSKLFCNQKSTESA